MSNSINIYEVSSQLQASLSKLNRTRKTIPPQLARKWIKFGLGADGVKAFQINETMSFIFYKPDRVNVLSLFKPKIIKA